MRSGDEGLQDPRESRRIRFYGELVLEEGENEIELVAVLHDDSEASETLRIAYTQVPPDPKLADELQKVRSQNEALIAKIRDDIAREMQAERVRRRLEVRVEEDALGD